MAVKKKVKRKTKHIGQRTVAARKRAQPKPSQNKSWKDVYEDLKHQIHAGILPEGIECPSELELCEIHGVSRGTVRRALSQLRNDGYCDLRPGQRRKIRKPDPLKYLRMPLHDPPPSSSFGEHLMEIAKQEGIAAGEKNLSMTELYTADEVFTTGTMGELTPIIMADGRTIGNGSCGPMTERLQTLHRQYAYDGGEQIPGGDKS